MKTDLIFTAEIAKNAAKPVTTTLEDSLKVFSERISSSLVKGSYN
tara:strand:+ start:17676 stop:17810 length:135 start_codon:yes stop_codon:yes gene_type:complete